MPSEQPISPVLYGEIPRIVGHRFGDDGSIWTRFSSACIDGRWRQRLTDRWRRRRLQKTGGQEGRLSVLVVEADGIRKNYLVHRLILEAFVGPCPEGMECRHLDGDPSNNRLENLRWGTPKENAADRVRHGTIYRGVGTKSPTAKLTDHDIPAIQKMHLEGVSYSSIARMYGVYSGTIRNACLGRSWSHLDDQTDISSHEIAARETLRTNSRGSRNPLSVLTEEDIPTIKRLREEGFSYRLIGDMYGSHRETVRLACIGRTWSHVAVDGVTIGG